MSALVSLFAAPLNSRPRYLARGAIARHDERSPVHHTLRLFFLFLLIHSAQITVSALPISQYESKVHEVVIKLASLEQWAKADSPAQHAERIAATFKYARDVIPADETIEWEGGRVRVNNSWLETELRNYEKLPPSDAHRAIALARIIERLSALEDRLAELRGQKVGAGTSKDEEKARIEGIVRREEFVEKPPQKNIFERAWERFKEWWNGLFSGGSIAAGQMSWLSFLAMILVFALAAAVIGYALWKLVLFLEKRRAKLKPEKREARVVLGERLAPDRTAADLLAEAEALARKGELRAAIRKGYIALLCELGDRKVLSLAQHKTNRDYLRDVRGKRRLLDDMQKLTNSFENHWYGFRQTTPDDWTAFRSGYEKVLSAEL